MEPLVAPLISQLLTTIIMPLALSLGGLGVAWVSTKLRQKANVDVEKQMNDLLHNALNRGAEAILQKINSNMGAAGSVSPTPSASIKASMQAAAVSAASQLAKQVLATNPDATKHFNLDKNLPLLEKLAQQAIEGAIARIKN
jgi:hypothetical protein